MPRRLPHKRSARPGSQVTLLSRRAFRVLAGVSDAELTLWEHEELIVPVDDSHDRGLEPLYEESALRRARLIRTLADELEVNPPGIGVILRLLDQMER
ncbi:MAG TPA: chaperone modulator CbpM [Candidatus Binataceae bacterium]|nr:chaperone modulator CbpM [Candidatus Binataceae bacterium]